MYDNYRFEHIAYQYEKLENQCRRMNDEIYRLQEYIDSIDKYLNDCDLDSLANFFIKHPDKFNKIVAKMRKEKLKNIENK